MQWEKKIGGPYSDGAMYLVNSPDSTILGAYSFCDSLTAGSSPDYYTRESLVKYDLSGNLIWDKKYGEYEFMKWLKSININDKGEIIVSEYKYSPFPHRVGSLFSFTNDGDSLWYREYEYLNELNSLNWLYGVATTNDDGYIAVGSIYPFPPDTGNQDVWVIKVDSLGCESWDICWVGEKEHIALRMAEQLKIFPNPASHELNIFVPKENEAEKHRLLIYDLYGRKVEETEVPSGTTTLHLNVSGWRSGLYTAIASYNGKITGRGKFVVR